MKTIKLTRGLVTKVDDADYDYLMKFTWIAITNKAGQHYAYANVRRGGKRTSIQMQRLLIIGGKKSKNVVDHINYDTLDNQRHNLRIATKSQNGLHRRYGFGSSMYIGVSYNKIRKKYIASITENGSIRRLGAFDIEIHAAIVRDIHARRVYGEFAKLNFP